MQTPDQQSQADDVLLNPADRAARRQEEAAATAQASRAYSALADNLAKQAVSYPDPYVRERYGIASKAIRRLSRALSEDAMVRRN